MGKRYKKPPIVEAVCEFRFIPAGDWDPTIADRLYHQLKDRFPTRPSPSSAVETVPIVGSDTAPRLIEIEIPRQHFKSADEQLVVQLGPWFLAINHLKPYSTWREFKPIIRDVLDAWDRVVAPAELSRIGLSTSNRMEFNEREVHFADYFDIYPHWGRLARGAVGFYMDIQFRWESGRDILTVAMSADDQNEMKVVDLDLEYFLNRPGAVPRNGVMDWLEIAHSRTRDSFEACLKPAMRRRFEEVD